MFHFKTQEKFWFPDVSTGYRNRMLFIALSTDSIPGKYFLKVYQFWIVLIDVDLNFLFF